MAHVCGIRSDVLRFNVTVQLSTVFTTASSPTIAPSARSTGSCRFGLIAPGSMRCGWSQGRWVRTANLTSISTLVDRSSLAYCGSSSSFQVSPNSHKGSAPVYAHADRRKRSAPWTQVFPFERSNERERWHSVVRIAGTPRTGSQFPKTSLALPSFLSPPLSHL